MSQDASVKNIEAISAFASSLASFSASIRSDAGSLTAAAISGWMWMQDRQNLADRLCEEMNIRLQQAECQLANAIRDVDDEDEPDYSKVNYWEAQVEQIGAALAEMEDSSATIHSALSLIKNYTDKVTSLTDSFRMQCSSFADAGVNYLRKAESDIQSYKSISVKH